MNDSAISGRKSGKQLSPGAVGGIMAVVALVSPVTMQMTFFSGYSMTTIVAMTWMYYFGGLGPIMFPFLFLPYILIASLPQTFLRIVFVAMMYRLYSGNSTKTRVIIVGIAAEIQTPVMAYVTILPLYLSNIIPIDFIPLIIPIPILLIIGLLILRVFPFPELKLWDEGKQVRDLVQESETHTKETPKVEDDKWWEKD